MLHEMSSHPKLVLQVISAVRKGLLFPRPHFLAKCGLCLLQGQPPPRREPQRQSEVHGDRGADSRCCPCYMIPLLVYLIVVKVEFIFKTEIQSHINSSIS